ncbi:MAG TPA: hypothetical protein VJ858_04685 [Acidimicrobiia bacterium]|nr:hypothetical protein [Acidimicrobiia bacterium]
MNLNDETTAEVLQSVWMVSHDHSELDEDCSPTKPCRNMQGVTFDGYAEEGADIGAAWRAQLAREGKLNTDGGSVRDLVLGRDQ